MVLNLPKEDVRQWAMPGVHSKGTIGPALQKQAFPATPAAYLTDAWSTHSLALPPAPVTELASNRDLVAEARSLTPPTAAASPVDNVARYRHGDADVTGTRRRRPGVGTARGLREAPVGNRRQLEAMRWARADDRESPAPVGKHGTAFLYRVGGPKKGVYTSYLCGISRALKPSTTS